MACIERMCNMCIVVLQGEGRMSLASKSMLDAGDVLARACINAEDIAFLDKQRNVEFES